MARQLVEELVFDMMESSTRKKASKPLPGRVITHRCESEPHLQRKNRRPNSVNYSVDGNPYDSGNLPHERYYTASTSHSPRLKQRQVHRSATTSDIQDRDDDDSSKNGVVLNMKQKLTHNIEHYSNLFQEITFPILFGRRPRSRSNSRNRSERAERRSENESNDVKARHLSERSNEDYPAIDNIELYQFNGFVFGSERETGKGHNFQPIQLSAPTWCDRCGEFIWGVYKQCLRCQNCQYTCHHPCRKAVALDCASVQNETRTGEKPLRSNQSETSLSQEKPQALICNESTVWYFKRTPSRRRFLFTQLKGMLNHVNPWATSDDVIYEDDTDSGYHTGDGSLREQALRYRAGGGHAPPHRLISPPPKPPGEYTLTREDLRNRIEAFNNNDYGLIMSLQQESNTFQGFIRVHINLIRPINMSLAVRPPSLYEVLTNEEEHPPLTPPSPGDPNDTQIASFYLPKDTTKVIHINSQTNTEEVIKLLLSKFKITDNPRKFALYEQTDEGEGEKCTKVMRKMAGDEQPLPLCLTWGADGLDTHRFILHENDSGDVIWEAFSVPELRNFLAILDREQDEYVDQLKAKYSLMQIHITRRMQELSKLRAKSSLASALTNKMAAATLADSNVPLDSSANAPKAQLGQTKLGGVVKLKKSDVHKDTPRPGEIPSSPEEQRSSVRGKSPPAESFNDDEREPIFV